LIVRPFIGKKACLPGENGNKENNGILPQKTLSGEALIMRFGQAGC